MITKVLPGTELEFRFTNYRGEIKTRHVLFYGVDYGSNDYYPEPTWMLRCYDLERGKPRSFSIQRIDTDTLKVLTLI